MADFDERARAAMGWHFRKVLTAAPVLSTVDWSVKIPAAVEAPVTPPTKTTPFPARALRHQRMVIGLISGGA